jgi:hypothetical protein
MNAMSMPGFTAEDSLYTREAQYDMTASKFLTAKAHIRPQRMAPEDCNELRKSILRRVNDAGQRALAGDWFMFNHQMDGINNGMSQLLKHC